MIQLFHNPNYNFIGRRRWAYLLSIAFILVGLGSMAMKGGLRYGIDFSGGTLIQVRFEKPVAVEKIRTALEDIKLGESVIQEFGDPREFILRLPLQNASVEQVTAQVQGALAKDPSLGRPEIRRVEFVGPQVGRDLQPQAIYAVLVSMAGILIYIAFRFDVKGGVASVAAIIHDVLVCHGNIIRWTLMRTVGSDTKNWLNLDAANCGLTVIAVRPDGTARLVTYSDVGHIPWEKQTWSGKDGWWSMGR